MRASWLVLAALSASAVAALGVAPGSAAAPPGGRPIVVELFTSQGCSSCPPADALVAALARDRADLLALTFHVTYWNNLGWQDPFSFTGATDRQRRYVALAVSPNIYTPDMVVDGSWDVIGSDRAAVTAALARAAAQAQTTAPITITRSPNTGSTVTGNDGDVTITIGAGTGHGNVLLLGYDRTHQTHIGRGENSGLTVQEANIVRGMQLAGRWTGAAVQLTTARPAGENIAVLVQAENGRILGAARLSGGAPDHPGGG